MRAIKVSTGLSMPHLLRLISLVTLCVLLYLYFLRVNQIQLEYKSHGFIMGDWLINYTNGLVRRGLLGEIAMQFHSWFDISPIDIVLKVKFITYAIICGSLFLLAIIKGVSLYEILFLISPWALMFDLNDPGGSGRKEILLFATFSLFTFFEKFDRSREKSVLRSWDLYFLFFAMVMMAFIHEGLIFFFQFFYLPLYLRNGFNTKEILVFLIPYIISLAILVILYLFFKGSEETAQAICNSLNPWSVNGSLGCDSIYLLAGEHPRVSVGMVKTYLPLLILIIIPLYFYGRWVVGINRNRLLIAMAISFLPTIPLYSIAIDWGRWIHIYGLLLFITLFSVKSAQAPLRNYSFARNIIVLCFAIPYIFYWRIPHAVWGNNVFYFWTQSPSGYIDSWKLQK